MAPNLGQPITAQNLYNPRFSLSNLTNNRRQEQTPPSQPRIAGIQAQPVQQPRTPVLRPNLVNETTAGYNCPPHLYVLKDKVCPFREVGDGCPYRTHAQNNLTKHVHRLHDPDYRKDKKRAKRSHQSGGPGGGPGPSEPGAQSNRNQNVIHEAPSISDPPNSNRNQNLIRETQSVRDAQTQTMGPATDNIDVNEGNNGVYMPIPANEQTPSLNNNNVSLSFANEVTHGPRTPPPTENNGSFSRDFSQPTATSTPKQSTGQPPEGPISIQLIENFTMIVNGPSKAGKTFFVATLLHNLKSFCEKPPSVVVWVYANAKNIHDSLKKKLVTQLIDVSDIIDNSQADIQKLLINSIKQKSTKADTHSLLIFDDCQLKPTIVKTIASLFNGAGRHNNISLIYICQQLYDKEDQKRISSSANYLTIFPNPRYTNEAVPLNTQLFGKGNSGIISAMLDVLVECEYLFINLTNHHSRKRLVLCDIFSRDHIIKAFVPF